jgi:hypothetical protein
VACDFSVLLMHGFPGNPSFLIRTTVINRKSVILLTSVLAYKAGLMPHQFINQYPTKLPKTVSDGDEN